MTSLSTVRCLQARDGNGWRQRDSRSDGSADAKVPGSGYGGVGTAAHSLTHTYTSSNGGRPVGAAMCHCWAKASFNWAQGDEKLLQLTLPFLSSCTSWPKPTPLSAAACWKGIEGSTRTLSLPLQLHLSQHQQCQGVPKKHQLINNSHRSNTLFVVYHKSTQTVRSQTGKFAPFTLC